ncbi:uncharacterized protein LACBIDRAFT_299868 [Laccaria bicolor S238N-H82]|uniref:Predicted protein n=1 Tax=Laccaria bicolor (strain S238N-H82 / ATCC MYA-4686) TaxID=486041 RepID=B0DFM1_LACBS|nr:uncharacterized protein LACBIDRAFT_299868 [Laccaria bicolor S238N-H82]EDR06892.1 predicted protein [Laccaria bicolor S238N-H82]|eukprot:XP_001882739.1 predicted protein [Laccaria bicolor S238N-H82]
MSVFTRFTSNSFNVADPFTWVLSAVFTCLPQCTTSALHLTGKRKEKKRTALPSVSNHWFCRSLPPDELLRLQNNFVD